MADRRLLALQRRAATGGARDELTLIMYRQRIGDVANRFNGAIEHVARNGLDDLCESEVEALSWILDGTLGHGSWVRLVYSGGAKWKHDDGGWWCIRTLWGELDRFAVIEAGRRDWNPRGRTFRYVLERAEWWEEGTQITGWPDAFRFFSLHLDEVYRPGDGVKVSGAERRLKSLDRRLSSQFPPGPGSWSERQYLKAERDRVAERLKELKG